MSHRDSNGKCDSRRLTADTFMAIESAGKWNTKSGKEWSPTRLECLETRYVRGERLLSPKCLERQLGTGIEVPGRRSNATQQTIGAQIHG